MNNITKLSDGDIFYDRAICPDDGHIIANLNNK